jgi:hypothetical protein
MGRPRYTSKRGGIIYTRSVVSFVPAGRACLDSELSACSCDFPEWITYDF